MRAGRALRLREGRGGGLTWEGWWGLDRGQGRRARPVRADRAYGEGRGIGPNM